MVHNRFGSARKATIEVAVVGSEDDPIIADDIDHVRELLFFRLAGEIKLAALQQLARLDLERRQLNTEHFVMLVHSFEPIGQPAAAGFQKNKTQLGKTVEHAFADDHRECDHLLEGVAEKMRVKEFIDALGAGGVRTLATEKHVDANRDV